MMNKSNNLNQTKVLVTGASGFIGSWLTEYLLDQGAIVTVLMADWNPDTYFVRSGLFHRTKNAIGSITDFDCLNNLIREHKIQAVFHLAAISVEGLAFKNPRLAFDINIRGTYNLLEACRVNADHIQQVVVASSDKAYGDSPILPYTEDLPTIGKNPYDVSKSCADMIARSYHHSYGLPVAVGRFGNIYGGGDLNWTRLMPNTIKRLLNREAPTVKMPVEGSFKRDFLYVQDAVSTYISMFEGLSRKEVQGEAFNFAMGGSWTVLEIVEKVQKIMGCEDIEPQIVPQTHGEIFHQHVSTEKAKRVLGWVPRYSLEAGLVETVAWYTNFLQPAPAVVPAVRVPVSNGVSRMLAATLPV